MNKAIAIAQLTAYTLKLAHCIKQNGQEKSSVTTLGKRQEMYQYYQNHYVYKRNCHNKERE
jgi:hypothetical protein